MLFVDTRDTMMAFRIAKNVHQFTIASLGAAT